MLEIRELTKEYNHERAVDRVDITVEDGQIAILLGPNGAGKSTLIKSVTGLLRYSGSVMIQGHPARSVEAKRQFAYVPELPTLFDTLTVAEHVEFVRRAYNSDMSPEDIEGLFARFELTDKKDKLGKELSKGMMQKVSICCALVIQPSVILFDEPMIGLDPKAIRELKRVILELRDKGATILISTHMLEMVEGLWDVVYIMNRGHIIGVYKKDEVADKELDDLFFSLTDSTPPDGSESVAAERTSGSGTEGAGRAGKRKGGE